MQPPPLPPETGRSAPATHEAVLEEQHVALHPTLPGMTPAIEDELLKYSEQLGISWEQGIAQAKANKLSAPQLLAFAQSQLASDTKDPHATH